MKNIYFLSSIILFLFLALTVQAEDLLVVCELKEELNFRSPLQVVYLKVNMQSETVNGIPGTVLGTDIITYDTETESLTLVLPSMYITVTRKGRGREGSDITYIGHCSKDELKF